MARQLGRPPRPNQTPLLVDPARRWTTRHRRAIIGDVSTKTRCNHCTLIDLRRAANARGSDISLEGAALDVFPGWTAARTLDTGIVTYFQELTETCEC